MPNIKSAKKRVDIAERNRLRNITQRSSMKTAVKDVRELALAGKKEEAQAKLPNAFSKIDKAVQKKIIKKNAGARLKSRLVKKIQAKAAA
jgi:small subunit ribosomal protein S20